VVVDLSKVSLTDAESLAATLWAGSYLTDSWSATSRTASTVFPGIQATEPRALSSTTIREIPGDVEHEVQSLFEAARDEEFEDGIESQFSVRLTNLIEAQGDLAMGAINKVMFGGNAALDAASEAMRWLGQMKDPETHLYRIWTLRQGLKSNSLRIRDGAALGLSFLADPRVIPDLELAISREPCAELRSDLESVLDWHKRVR
jgi:hypothetical protein